jgi:hypothetical protein
MASRREFLDAAVKGAAGVVLAGPLAPLAALSAAPAMAPPAGKERLIDVLKAVNKPVELVTCPDGTVILLLPYGGRVLGVFSPGSDENFYWTNPALSAAETARVFYAGKAWQNSGGDRTWLAPEVDVFLPKFPNLDTYWQPRELDPGNYQVVKTGDSMRLVNRLTVTLSRSQEKVDLEIAKAVGPAPNPLRYERGLQLGGVEYAGYTQYTSLEILGESAPGKARVGLWNLVQMPHGGDLLVPAYFRSEPTVCFGNIAPEDLIVGDHLIRYKMRAAGEHKITIGAIATTGRVGYFYATGDRWALIIRNFAVNPSGEYVDVPWKDPDHLGYSTQACNVNSGLGRFSELEYHIPAVGAGTGRKRCDDAAQVWAFRGRREQIRTVAANLLCQIG